MRSSKKLGEIIGKWRKRRKGHFVVYAKEGKRFVVPLCYLNHPIFKVLLEMAEEEFGSTVHGPLQVPCEEELMDYLITLLRNNQHLDIQNPFLSMNKHIEDDVSRFVIPLQHLERPLSKELLKMAEDEFGLDCNGPIRLPCDALFVESVLSSLKRKEYSRKESKIDKALHCLRK